MTAYDSNVTGVNLPAGQTVLGVCPGGNAQSYDGDWPTARTQIETLLNASTSGHRVKMLHAIMGGGWTTGSYLNCRGMLANLPGDVQPLWTIPTPFPQYEIDTAGNFLLDSSGQKIAATYQNAVNGKYDAVLEQLYKLLFADFPLCSLRQAHELEGGWFWHGLGNVSGTPSLITGGTPALAKQFFQHIGTMRKDLGHKGTLEVNCGKGTSPVTGQAFSCADVFPGKDYADICGVDTYDVANTTAQAADAAGAWNNVQAPMIQQAIDAARTNGVRWAMSEWSCSKYVDGTAQTLCGDDPYFMDHVRSMALDNNNPDCAYLSLFWNNDVNADGTIHRLDAMAQPATHNTGPWSWHAEFPQATGRLAGTDWTVTGLTRVPPPAVAPIVAGSTGRRRTHRLNPSTVY